MTSEQEQLAKKLRRNRNLSVFAWATAPTLIVAFLVYFAVSPGIANRAEERRAFDAAKVDFQETWCSTYGIDPRNYGVEEWMAYIDRNREYLEANKAYLGITERGIDGELRFTAHWIEFGLESLTYGYVPPEDFWFGNGTFEPYFAFFEFGPEGNNPPPC